MIDQEKQSEDAKAKGICHTEAECVQMYKDLTPEVKAPALAMLAMELEPVKAEIQAAYDKDPEGWIGPYHFFWGMGVRNLLREKGFGEEYFKIHNLDDIYVALVEEALKLGGSNAKLAGETDSPGSDSNSQG
jgi:hypothetical protein